MEIQPRTFGDVLGQLINMLGKVWRPVLLPALLSAAVIAFGSFLILNETGSLEFFDLTWNDPAALEAMSVEELNALAFDFLTSLILITGISTIMYGFIYLVAARAVGEEMSGRPSGRSVAGAALGLLLPFLVASILVAVGTTLGLVLLVVPGIWFGVSMTMVAPVMAIENAGPVEAMRRSHRLVKGKWWETIGFLMLIGLIGGTAAQVIQVVALPVFLVGDISFAFGITIALAIAVQGLIMAAIAVGATVWYLNLRARTDGPYLLEIS